ncbi:MAG: type II secretion system protein [Patescibacteria group bacterium]
MKIKSKAFTLVELLIVMAIIGVLAAIVVVNLTRSQKISRDARRVADLDTINTALMLHYDSKKKVITSACDNNTYTVNDLNLNHFLVDEGYLPSMPKDPKYPTSGNYYEQYLYVSTTYSTHYYPHVASSCGDYSDSVAFSCSASTGSPCSNYFLYANLETDKYQNITTESLWTANHMSSLSFNDKNLYYMLGPNK